MFEKCELWKEWTFSSGKIDQCVEKIVSEDQGSDLSLQWLYLKNFTFQLQVDKPEPDETLSEENYSCDIEGIAQSALEVIESNASLDENEYKNLPKKLLAEIFCRIQGALSETGFLNFCKVLLTWDDQKLIDICCDYVVLNKLKENEEAKLPTIGALTELAKKKPDSVSRCITRLLIDSSNFSDAELLENLYAVMPNEQKESIIMALTEEENFKESNWHLLQALSCGSTTTSLSRIISFMNVKCDEFSRSQAFARLLVHICKNLESDIHNDILLNIIQKNKTLLKKQALKHLSTLEHKE